MNYKSKLMGLSLILLAAISACTDEMENGGSAPGMDDHRISFAVSTQNQTSGTRSAVSPETHELGSVEMEGTLDGRPLFLSAEVADGFPCDHQPLTRGTQVTAPAQMNEFSVSAEIGGGTEVYPKVLDVMYNVKATKGDATSTNWTTAKPYYWPTGKTLNFYAWYPYNSKNLTIPNDNNVAGTELFYEIPEQVADQEDFMMSKAYNATESGAAVSLHFYHMLTAVKFKTGNNIPACHIKSITLKNVKYKGTHSYHATGSGILPWTPNADTKSFTLSVNQDITMNTETILTEEGKTLFMMPQKLGDEARLEVNLVVDGVEKTLGAKLSDITADLSGRGIWNAQTTVTYKISFQDNIELDLSKDVFVASGDDAVIYVKSNLDWVCTLSDPNGIAGDAAPALCKPSLKGNTNGVKSDNFSNENAKLTIETISPTDTQTRKGKVKLTFMFPSKPGKTVEKEVTLTSSLMVEYPAGKDIWYKVTKGTITGEKLVTTDIPAIPDNADFATAIAKVVGADVTYSRELVATRVLNDDDATQCLTKFAIRRAKADGSTTTVIFSVITLERQDDSLTFDEKNFMTWGDIYYPIGSTWVVNKDNFNVTTNTEDLGKKSVWESIAAPSWSYNQANFSFMDPVYMMPGYRTMQNTNLTIYSIEKVSN